MLIVRVLKMGQNAVDAARSSRAAGAVGRRRHTTRRKIKRSVTISLLAVLVAILLRISHVARAPLPVRPAKPRAPIAEASTELVQRPGTGRSDTRDDNHADTAAQRSET